VDNTCGDVGWQTTLKKVGPVWGFGADGEMSNIWKRTAQEGLWLSVSGLTCYN
jgi:hypothetical protein